MCINETWSRGAPCEAKMPWFIPWSDVIKKKVCRYLLQRYLGQFLDEKLSLEQLNVDLYNGTGTVSNIALYSKVTITKQQSIYVCSV